MKWFLSGIISTCLVMLGCNQKENSHHMLRLAFLSEANSLDPRYGYEIPANHLVKMLFEGLMRMTPEKVLVPAACERYTISEDQKTYTFTLRSANWSNGKPVTAYDFEYAWRWVINPQTGSQGASDFYPIKNAEKIIKGELPVDTIGIRVLDAKTLVVELENPTPYFLELTATSAFSPIYAHYDAQDPQWAQKQGPHFVSNGPFQLKERVFRSHLVLVKNPLYWNADQVKVENIHISIVEDAQTQLAMFEKHQIDWLGKPFAKLPLDAVPSLRKKELLTIFPEKGIYWYFLNTEKFPFTNAKIREAFSIAIDRKSIVDHVLQESETAATSVNQGQSFFSDGNIEKAQALFNEALAELNLTQATFPPVALSFCNLETNFRIASVVQQQWQNAFGIQVILDGQEWTTYYNNLVKGNYLVGGLSWHSRIRDPIYNLSLFKCKQDNLNISRWENPQFQQLIEKAQQAKDPGLRSDLLNQAEALLMHEMPIIPIYFLSVSYAKNKNLRNVYISEINEIDFAWASKL